MTSRTTVVAMVSTHRRRWQRHRVTPGDGSRLPDVRLRQASVRTPFRLDLDRQRTD